jgi:hypothetical protein
MLARGAFAGLVMVGLMALGGPARAAGSAGGQRIDLGIVLLERSQRLDGARLVEDYCARWKPLLATLKGEEGDAMVLDLGDALATVRLERKPLAGLDSAVQASWQWDGARTAVDRHPAHLVIEVGTSRGEALANTARLTRVVASVVAVTRPRAVFWTGAAMLIDPAKFVAESAVLRTGQAPVLLWLNVLPAFLEPKEPVVHTIGFGRLGLPELILVQGAASDEDVFDRLLRASELILHKRLNVRRGNRLELSATERLVAEEVPAPWNPKEMAIRLTMVAKRAPR